MKRLGTLVTVVLLVVLVTGLKGRKDESIDIQISPNILALHSQAVCFTIHADISCSKVESGSVQLDTGSAILTPYSTFADDLGNLVAKFDMTNVKGAVETGEVDFTLSGDTQTCGFSGTQTVTVKLSEQVKIRKRIQQLTK